MAQKLKWKKWTDGWTRPIAVTCTLMRSVNISRHACRVYAIVITPLADVLLR